MMQIVSTIVGVIAIISIYFYSLEYDKEKVGYMLKPIHYSWPSYMATNIVSSYLHQLADYIAPPHTKVYNEAYGTFKSQIIYTICKFQIAEILKAGPMTVDELAQIIQIKNSNNLKRLLRAAQSLGYFYEDSSTGYWKNNQYSALLHPDHPTSMYYLIKHWKEDTDLAWLKLYDILKDDTLTYEDIYGISIWEKLKQDPDQEHQFHMTENKSILLRERALILDYKWQSYYRVVDIGGSLGTFTISLLKNYPTINYGVIFDQPQVIIDAENHLKQANVTKEIQKKIDFHSGNFLDVNTLPVFYDRDVIILSRILHNWDDTHVITILSNIKQAILTSECTTITLIIIDTILPLKDLSPYKYMIDLLMKVVVNGQERSQDEWTILLTQSGFNLKKVYSTRSTLSIIEAVPIFENKIID